MTFVFVSNYFNHHQAPFAKAMDGQTGHNFFFIETEPIAEERVKMGWGQETKPSYVIQSYTDTKAEAECRRLILDADVVIWGSCPFGMIKPRLRQKKLTFAYSERLFKRGFKGVSFWGRALKYKLKLGPYQNDKHFLLCASAYAAGDYERLGLFRGKTYKWGYFPEVKEQDIDGLFARKRSDKRVNILWAGRLIDWKHPESAIYIAERLVADAYDFEVQIIGSGKMEASLKEMIREKRLEKHVSLLGSMPPEKVREYMEAADIFLFTSDYNEGWGAVLNEAMNSGCAVVASNAAGSVPFLLEDGVNGLVYENGDTDELCDKMRRLLDDAQLRREYGVKAYETLRGTWNSNTAAKNILRLSSSLLSGSEPEHPSEGPCSSAVGKRQHPYLMM